MASSITCIPATRNVFTAIPMTFITKRRVAAYARVSTDSDEQFTSYAAQIDYYTKFIQQHEDWAYRKVIWRCNAKFNGEHKCATPHLTEEEIKAMFLKAYNQLMGNREQVIADCRLMLEMLSDHSKLDAQIAKANEEIALVSGLVSACVHENAEKAQEQDAFNKRYNSLVDKHQKSLARLDRLIAACEEKVTRQKVLRNYIDALTTAPFVLDAWDEQLWRLLVVKRTVHRDGGIEFEFLDGKKLHVTEDNNGEAIQRPIQYYAFRRAWGYLPNKQ